MSNATGTIESVAIELSKLMRPLESELATPARTKAFLVQIGFILTDAQIAGIAAPLSATANNTTSLIIVIEALIAAIDVGNSGTIATKSIESIEKIADIINSLSIIGSQIGGLVGVSASVVAKRLFDYLLFNYLEVTREVNDALELAGLLDRDDRNEDSEDPNNPPFTIVTYHFDRIGGWFSDPAGQVRTLYDWGENSFDGRKLFSRIENILAHNGLPVIYDNSGATPRLDIVLLEAVPKTDVTPRGLLIRIKNNISPGTQVIPVSSDAKIELQLDFQLPTNTGFSILSDGKLGFVPATPGSSFNGNFMVKVIAEQTLPPDPFILFGRAGGSRLELGKFALTTGTRVTWDGSKANGNFMFEGAADALKVVIDTSTSDGFLAKILPATKVEADFSLQLGISKDSGFYFNGSSALEIQLPTHIDLGLVSIAALTIAAKLDKGNIPVSVGANIRATLGPLVAVVQNMGVKATFSFPPNNSGNLGPLQFDLGFKPPNGVGLSVDAGVVKGGGYLYFDFDREEYAGAIELVFSEFLNLKAIGLITTKMPDGSKGFSLLIIITAEFGTGIQLGFGFTLLGVGGLIGLNRTMRQQPLTEGIRTGAINSILFPKDVIANAPRIISDLRTIFPPEQGKFLIGPMAKLGWGTPTLISLSLGIIIEIPGNIAILGVLKVALPTVDAPLLVLQVNFIGAIEFDKKRIWFFASLFESRLLFMTLEGEMGLLVAFGDDANFVVSVGGFHPQFNPPPLPFPNPARISINYINEPNARIRVMNYFAITSNTAQIGAHSELFFGFGGFSVEGHMGFDALIQFSPFHFIIEVSASVALKAFGVGVFSISLRFSLEGTNPWRARGTGSISLFFFDISADFDITWGEERNTTLPPIDVMPILKAEFEKIDNWRALLPTSNNLLVSLRKLETAADTLVLHPVGVLKISQKAIPLDLKIDKVGNQKSSDAKKLRVAVTSTGLGKKSDAQEQFAIAQFQNMEDASKLSRPAYEPQHGGLELSVAGQQLASSRMVKRVIRYEEIIIDNNFKRFVRHFSIFVGALFNHFMAGASISKSSLSQSYLEKLQPFDAKIAVQPASYAVAFQATNKSIGTTATFTSQASANDYLQQQIAIDPNMSDALHVIPTHEVVSV